MKKIFTLIALAMVVACAPKIKTNLVATRTALADDAEVLVLGMEKQAPASALDIGAIKIGDTGFSTNCSWEKVIEKAKEEARKAGGNIVKITKHTPPNLLGSSCHRIEGRILLVEDTQALSHIAAATEGAIDTTWNYAKLYVYRPGGHGALISYNLHLGDSVIARVQNNSIEELIIKKKGLNTLWARTESRAEVPIDIEYGKSYYLRCGVKMGVMAGRPELALVDAVTGKAEYTKIQQRKEKRNTK